MHDRKCVHLCNVCVAPAELVVAESVVVIKKLLQMQPEQHSDIIKHMAKLTDNIQVRCATWLVTVRISEPVTPNKPPM